MTDFYFTYEKIGLVYIIVTYFELDKNEFFRFVT
jgi:hypothetical protein